MSAPKRYRKKPVEIVALQLTRDNVADVEEFIHGKATETHIPGPGRGLTAGLKIETLEGTMLAAWGDYVIRGVQGEFYPCKPDIFAETYDDPEDVDPLLAVRRAEQRLVEAREALARANEAPKT
ncbi:hypothetical protein SEA_PHLOP_78 [Gordonia phage Phlop]|uniref:Uncharacterized protein n=7 Tax=Wizardvirus TaxID=2169658 RepID=A0A890USD7_9CAUD|nr:hypothetical protein BH794_gp77 [Gordonia phage Wizard]YP_010096686.1 hypothetical protein KNT95_gp81 [Gordonia phage Danyall]YP_010096780.1 hypothetical protein KNT96_gp80 [Gordonia phage KimmyK]YP_010103094.1 hypothetical protein KNU63_gp84 [Gordonia phage RogerDodger]YP_010109715.1 hypothetical protein KNV19_gp81 [Gordonia phage Portcullis]YP_010114997.1 hypothetical protein KNV78_gp78 [Gordonia phage Phlop]UVK63789.1 hypothetical protein SEA_PULLUMCAVEA_79 [Gordonia phage PullumCavea]